MLIPTIALMVVAPPQEASAPVTTAPVAAIAVLALAPITPADSLVPQVAAMPADQTATREPPVDPAALPGQEADIVVRARADWEAPDPMSAVNVEAFKATMAVDRNVLAPVSLAYKKHVPGPFRRGVHNFLYNLREPVVFVNYFLQHKIGKAVETAGRFIINSTIGAIGLFDVARRKPFRLPRRSNGFANTLGYYGVPNGAFLYLPLVGPTTIRDLFGGAVDRLVMPIALGQGVTDPKFAIPAGVLGALDHRSEFDETYTAIGNAPGDPYANQRDFYLQRRQAEIDHLHGRGSNALGSMDDPPSGPIRLKRRGADSVVLPVPGEERVVPPPVVPTISPAAPR